MSSIPSDDVSLVSLRRFLDLRNHATRMLMIATIATDMQMMMVCVEGVRTILVARGYGLHETTSNRMMGAVGELHSDI